MKQLLAIIIVALITLSHGVIRPMLKDMKKTRSVIKAIFYTLVALAFFVLQVTILYLGAYSLL